MFQHKRIVVWSLALALFALAPRDAAASEPNCTESYLLCLNGAYALDGGAIGTLAEAECTAEWLGCAVDKMKWW